MDKKWNQFLVLTFLGCIALFSLATWIVKPADVLDDENRKAAKLPKLNRANLLSFPQAFEAYFNDRFFSRSMLVKARNWLRYECWQISAAPNIVVGKSGWLYFLGETATVLSSKEEPFTTAELEKWKSALQSRTSDFEKRGVKYFFVVAPNKQSIYPEYFPLFRPHESRLDQLNAYLKEVPGVNFISLKEALLAEKKDSSSLYFKTDTHWNELGAFVADRYITAMISSSFPAVQPLSLNGFALGKEVFGAGDCTKLMGLFGWIKESSPILNPLSSEPKLVFQKGDDRTIEYSIWRNTDNTLPASAQKLGELPKAVVFHDSFGDGLKPFIGRHFSRSVFQLRQADLAVDMDLIEKEKPDVVIQELVERHVIQLLPYGLHDWRHDVLEAIQASRKTSSSNSSSANTLSARSTASQAFSNKEQWLCVLPHTTELNSVRLAEVLRAPHSTVRSTTCREWTDAGVRVKFDPATASYFDWYLTKSGDQGKEIKDPDSAKAYTQLDAYIQKSGNFENVKTLTLLDGSKATLWKAKKSD